jgi:hypothetical protein
VPAQSPAHIPVQPAKLGHALFGQLCMLAARPAAARCLSGLLKKVPEPGVLIYG